MTQHDFNISNQSFPSFRIDLNNALESLASLSAGAVAPSNPFPNQLWADTSNSILKRRNSSNTEWLNISRLDQEINLNNYSGNPNGSVIPLAKGELLLDKLNNCLYFAEGINNNNWVKLKSSLPLNYRKGGKCKYINNNSILVEAFECRSSDNTTDILIKENTNVSLNYNGLNGLDAGVKAPYTWYYLYAISKEGGIDKGFILSKINENKGQTITLPETYNKKRQLPFAFRTDINGNIINFFHDYLRDEILYYGQNYITNGNSTVYADIDCCSYMPEIARIGKFKIEATNSADSYYSMFVKTKGFIEETSVFRGKNNNSGRWYIDLDLLTDENQIIQYKVENSSISANIAILGFKITEII